MKSWLIIGIERVEISCVSQDNVGEDNLPLDGLSMEQACNEVTLNLGKALATTFLNTVPTLAYEDVNPGTSIQ